MQPILSRRAVLAGTAATLLPIRVRAGEVAHRLTILHVNDIHSRHDPVDDRALTCAFDAAHRNCLGGTARLAGSLALARRAAEAAGRTVLLLDAGDQFQGSLFYTAWKGDVELAVAHAQGTEAMAVGNHEFDDGPANLARFVRAARFPVLSANLDASREPALAGLVKPWTIIDKAGLRIGVVGLTTPETLVGSSPGPNIAIGDPAAALIGAAAAARAAGAMVVVALSHLGVDVDRALAASIPAGTVAAVVGGHSHTLLSDSEPGAAGPAHAVVNGAAVAQAACYARYGGRLDLDLDADGRVVAFDGDVRHIGPETPEDADVARIVASYGAKLDGVRNQVVGHAPAPLGNTGCRVAECPLGDFVADAMLRSTEGADVAILNGGGMRIGLPGGAITRGDVLAAFPFGNMVATLRLRGGDLGAAVAYGLSRSGRGAFPQVAGMRVRWSPGSLDISVRDQDGAFRPLDPDRIYTVVTIDFLRRGGDGYALLKTAAIDPYDNGPPLDEVVAKALTGDDPLQGRTDGRIAATP